MAAVRPATDSARETHQPADFNADGQIPTIPAEPKKAPAAGIGTPRSPEAPRPSSMRLASRAKCFLICQPRQGDNEKISRQVNEDVQQLFDKFLSEVDSLPAWSRDTWTVSFRLTVGEDGKIKEGALGYVNNIPVEARKTDAYKRFELAVLAVLKSKVQLDPSPDGEIIMNQYLKFDVASKWREGNAFNGSIRAVVRRMNPAISLQFENVLARHTEEYGKFHNLKLRFTIDSDGHPQNVRVVDNSLRKVEGLAEKAIRDFENNMALILKGPPAQPTQFKKPDGGRPVEISYPIVFQFIDLD